MNYAVIFAAGRGRRMGGGKTPKQFISVCGEPVLIHSIKAFEQSEGVDGICVVCLESWIAQLRESVAEASLKKVRWIVPGGETGQKSIYKGLNAIFEDSPTRDEDIVLISDGVRPFVGNSLIEECIRTVKEKGSAVPICPVPETVVEIPDQRTGKIEQIPDRSRWFLSKAPQGFYLKEIVAAHRMAMAEGRFDCTNSAELMMRYGHSLYVVEDIPENIKVTTPSDLLFMRAILQNRQEGIEGF